MATTDLRGTTNVVGGTLGLPPPLLQSGIAALWSGVTSVASSGWSAFKAASMSTKLALVTGASALIAPEETAEFLQDTAEFVTDTAVGIIGTIASSLFSNPLLLIGGGIALWLLLRNKNKRETIYVGGSDVVQ